LLYIYQLINRGLVYTFNYSNEHRKSLLKTYPDIATFIEKFQVSRSLLDGLIAYGKSSGLVPNQRSIEQHNERLKGLMKAYIARGLYGESGFFPIFLPYDEDFIKAMEVLK
jgi:carboxyl-terminal processing protease